jgi:alpha-beta hydrolase superfamily lysophospholipase
MNLAIDDDVKSVAEFMQSTIPAARLHSVAESVGALAPLLWGHFPAEEVRAIALVSPPISGDDPHTPQASRGHRLVQ